MTRPVSRTVDRVEEGLHAGPDAQVDDKRLLILPTDPARTDPFLVLAEDWFSAPGFEWHPHRGLETVTYVVDGVLEHGDSLGNAGALQAGDVQWMTAGRGIIHRELAYRDERAHTLQLWLNLPAAARLTDTRYQDLLASARPRITRPGVTVDVISGTVDGVTGPALNHWPVQSVVVTLDPGAKLDLPVPAADRAFALVLAGAAAVAGRTVRAGQVAWSDPAPGGLALRAADPDRPVRVMVCSGRPVGEPIVLGGPFVMNSAEEIEQAYRDFRTGTFGPVPKTTRL
ncbi:pirin family protein [Pseudonocardia sp. CNS-139]|nr:pirin family protein [Pseudonocardia sp. CNS-139]